jgi:hypothetical protein
MPAARWALAVGAAVAIGAAGGGSAHAQQRESAADSAPGTWYGWQILLTDGAAVSLVGLGTLSSSNGVAIDSAIASSLVYFGGGPIVHGLHDRGLAAGESFGLRLGLPFTMGLIGAGGAWALSGGCGSGSGCMLNPGEGALGGALFGIAAASVIDIAVLAHEPRARDASTGLSLRPTPVWIREAGRSDAPGLGVAGVF